MHMRVTNAAAATVMMTVAAVTTMTSPTLFWNLQMKASSRERAAAAGRCAPSCFLALVLSLRDMRFAAAEQSRGGRAADD